MLNVKQLLTPTIRHQGNPIDVLQRAISQAADTDVSQLLDALDATVQQRLWATRRCIRGNCFESFAEFAVALSPHGLGARSIKPLKFLLKILLGEGYYSECVELVERTMRNPGRPRKTLANGEDFSRFYKVDTSSTARIRMLLALKHGHLEIFSELCERGGSIRKAAIKAGVVGPAPIRSLRRGVCDLEAAKRLPTGVKPKLMRELFCELGLDAQCTFLKGLEPVLGPDLARKWRAHNMESVRETG